MVVSTTGQANEFIILQEAEGHSVLIGSARTLTASIMTRLHDIIQLPNRRLAQLGVLNAGTGNTTAEKLVQVLLLRDNPAQPLRIFTDTTASRKTGGDSCTRAEITTEMGGKSMESALRLLSMGLVGLCQSLNTITTSQAPMEDGDFCIRLTQRTKMKAGPLMG